MAKVNLIERAIQLVGGSESKLGRATGYSQVAINKAKRRVEAGGKVSPDMAAAIDRATNGGVPKHKLRPDIFDAPAEAGSAA